MKKSWLDINIENLSLEEIESFEYLTKEDLDDLSFIELCFYMEILNKIGKKYEELRRGC